MKDVTERFFSRGKVDVNALTDYGFIKNGDVWAYGVNIVGTMRLTVEIDSVGRVFACVKDTDFDEEYALVYDNAAEGGFVGTVRSGFEKILRDVAEKCFQKEPCLSSGANAVIEYVRRTYGAEPEYLWEKFPRDAVWRRADNKKWFGALLTVDGTKLGLDSGEREVLDLRAAPEDIDMLIDGVNYFPGYHMNKKHWITLILDGNLRDEEIFAGIDASFVLAGGVRGKKTR